MKWQITRKGLALWLFIFFTLFVLFATLYGQISENAKSLAALRGSLTVEYTKPNGDGTSTRRQEKVRCTLVAPYVISSKCVTRNVMAVIDFDNATQHIAVTGEYDCDIGLLRRITANSLGCTVELKEAHALPLAITDCLNSSADVSWSLDLYEGITSRSTA